MKIIFWAYRQWGSEVYLTIERHSRVEEAVFCKDREEVLKLPLEEYDLLLTCGLSEEFDRYSCGTPIQLQIIDGIRYSKHRMFSFTYEENSKHAHTHSRKYADEVTLDLTGNMTDILEQLTATSKVLSNQFLDEYPNNEWKIWPEEEIICPKRKPEDSALFKEDLINMNTEQMYNFFRCLEEPYPNGYIEDEKGCLYIERVRYTKKQTY